MFRKRIAVSAAAALFAFVGNVHGQQTDDYTVQVVAGTVGFDQIQPFMAEQLKLWDKYKVKVKLTAGNYQRSNQILSIGQYDVGYDQIASSIRYNAAGIDNTIVAPSSVNCSMIVSSPDVTKWADLKGKRVGISTKFDVQYLTLTHYILPRFGLSATDVQLIPVASPEAAAALLTGNVGAVFTFAPYGEFAIEKGARSLLAADDLIDKKDISSGMLRNSMIMSKKFIKEHPELAKRMVWAHMDAINIMRKDPAVGIQTILHYQPKLDPELLRKASANCGWVYNEVPKVWIDTLIKWMKEDNLLRKPVTYEDVAYPGLAQSYPGYPGYEKIK
jgi:ABC-type nitrate/sulfonate/bicarbonate transport system substrate-binding protein